MLKPVAPPPEAAIARAVQPCECPHCGGTFGDAEKLPAALLTHTRCPHCARSFLVPGQIDEFVLADRIKSGGSGSLYRARDSRRGCDVAIKFLPASSIAEAAATDRLRQQVQTLSQLHSPHVASVFDFRIVDGLPFLVLELVTGESMAARLESLHRIPEREVLRMARDIADGLAALHDAGLIHGNVTPGSIVTGPDGSARLANLGLLGSQRRDDRGAILGTPLFIATEVLKGGVDAPRSDIYSLGVTLYLLLTGQPPFEGKTLGDRSPGSCTTSALSKNFSSWN